MRITRDGFRLTNPGGLWGITVDRLGTGDHPAVNEHLYQICRNVEGRSGRVIEAMGTGIREVRRSLREAGMAEPRFYDNGVSFSVRFPNSALIPDGDLGGVWVFRAVCFERVVLSSPGCLWPGRVDDYEEVLEAHA